MTAFRSPILRHSHRNPWSAAVALLLTLAAPLPAQETGRPEPENLLDPSQDPEVLAARLRAQFADMDDNGPVLELSLDGAVETALRYNLGLKIEEQSTEIARLNSRGSWGAFNWLLGSDGQIVKSSFQGESQLAGASVLKSFDQNFGVDLTKPLQSGGQFFWRYGRTNVDTNNQFRTINPSTTDLMTIQLTKPLLRGAGTRYTTATQEIAELDYLRQRERQRGVRQQLIFDVTNAYWDLVNAKEQLTVQESSLTVGTEQLEQNRRRLDAGVGTEVEVLQAEADVARRVEQVLLARVTAGDRADLLKQLLFQGADPGIWSTVLRPITPLPVNVDPKAAPPWEDALDTALDYRTELRQQRFQVTVAETNHYRTLNERLYSLNLDLSARSQGFSGDPQDAFDTVWRWDFPTLRGGFTFQMPIGNVTARYAERAARVNLRAAKLAYDQLQTQIAGEVRRAVRQVIYQAQAVRAAETSVDLAERQLEAEQARYREGLSTNFQVLQFLQDLQEARQSEVTARVNYAKALTGLRSSMGIVGES